MRMRPAGVEPVTRNSKRFAVGFTLSELVVVICVVGVIIVIAAGCFLYWDERAEKAALEAVLSGIKMGLQIRMAEMIMTNQQAQVATLESDNPLRWLEQPPGNYAGEYAAPAKRGYWYYAEPERELIYLPNNSAYLDTGQSGAKELWFRIVVRYETSAVTGGRVPAGIGVVPARGYNWF
jgi:Tfp pilus assembly protein PilE